MVVVESDSLARLPDLQIGTLPTLHSLINNFGKDPRFLREYQRFLDELQEFGAPTVRPSFWPVTSVRHANMFEEDFLVAMDRWGFADRAVRTLPIHDQPQAIVYLSGGIPVLYREIGKMNPKVDGSIGAPVPAMYAAAVGYNAAYEQSLQK